MTDQGHRLERLIEQAGYAHAAALGTALPRLRPDLFGGEVSVEGINGCVFRVAPTVRPTAEPRRSVVVKQLSPALAALNERIVGRWLPRLGLTDAAPAILGRIGDSGDPCVSLVFEDVGPSVLDPVRPTRDAVSVVIDVVAALHTRAAGSSVLHECRGQLEDKGIDYFVSSVGDAAAALESLGRLMPSFSAGQQAVCRELLARLHALGASVPRRSEAVRATGGPATLLHGDLWTINVLVFATATGLQAQLIDWDRAGVGPVSYDLSTLLLRFERSERSWVAETYRGAVARAGWRLPDDERLNLLFETAEYARYASRVTWPAQALLGGRSGGRADADRWHDELARILMWFEALAPVLPV